MTEQTQVETQDVTLSIEDIANATQILKAAIERSAFSAEEMSGVSGVFDKFAAFIGQVEANAKEAEAAEAEANADVTETKDDEAKAE